MALGHKCRDKDDKKSWHMMSTKPEHDEKVENVKKVKTYDQVRHEAMEGANENIEHTSQVISKLKKPFPRKK